MTNIADLKDRYRARASRRPGLTFPDILSDPLVREVMRADGVKPAALQIELGRIANYLRLAPPRAPVEPCMACG